MTDANFRCAGYAPMIEDNPDQRSNEKEKRMHASRLDQKSFLRQSSRYQFTRKSKFFLAIYMAFLEFAHILWETSKPTIVLTDNKSVTRFFQTKVILPSLWNACECVLQFNFKIAPSAGSVNNQLQIGTQSHGEDPSQNQGGCTNNTHRDVNSLLRCCR